MKIKPEPYINKKLRSKRPRRIRSQISPILKNREVSALSVDSSSCSYFGDELVSVESKLKKTKRQFREIEGNERSENATFRRLTRSYYKQIENERRENEVEVEVSESSCVDSYSGAVFGERSSNLKRSSENVEEIEGNEVSEISCVEQVSGAGNLKFSSENKENDTVSFTSGLDSCSVAKFDSVTKESENRAALEYEISDISRNDVVSASDFVVDQKPNKSLVADSDLTCTEQFSYDDVSENSSSHETLYSDIFPENSDFDFSDYTYSPSIFVDSGSEFSGKSIGDSTHSLTHSLLLEFRQQFSRSTAPQDIRIRIAETTTYHDSSKLVRFENEEDEESYKRLRERERRQVFLHDYAEEYLLTTEYGDLILQQRLLMVHWIIEQCTGKEFQEETMFLGVSLLDRFLSKGFFKNKRSLQIVGIACLALATRIEENQPYNSVRQRNFYIGSNTYSRCEVVAMEWLVQEVLNFKCFLPTIYNFLWFYLKAARADAEVEKKAKYLAVLALSDHEQLCYWPSSVAAGLVILASLESNQDATYQQVIEIHVRTKDSDLPECIKSLECLLQYAS